MGHFIKMGHFKEYEFSMKIGVTQERKKVRTTRNKTKTTFPLQRSQESDLASGQRLNS